MAELDQANDLFLIKKIDDAIRKYAQILKNDPGNLIVLNNMGYALSKLKKFDAALEMLRKIIKN